MKTQCDNRMKAHLRPWSTWWFKLLICVSYDLFDMTLGRLLFTVPFVSDVIGMALCGGMFGMSGLLYGLEMLDISEQVDGFIPTATFIALANRPKEQQLDTN